MPGLRRPLISAAVTVRVHPDKAEKYEAMLREILPLIRQEPGVVFWDAGTCRGKPDCFRIVEIYHDEAGLAAHYQTAHFQAAKPVMEECVASIESERYDSFLADE